MSSHSVNGRVKTWEPSAARVEGSDLRSFQNWLRHHRGVHPAEVGGGLGTYAELHRWSVGCVDDFWESVWEYYDLVGDRGAGPVREGESIADTRWFPDARLNYAENLLRFAGSDPDREAVVGLHESRPRQSLTWRELEERTASLAAHFRSIGVRRGDVVCAVLPNVPETIVALLAAASVGAIWSVVNTDFGVRGVSDRFTQIAPRVLLTVDGYDFNGRYRDMTRGLPDLIDALPTIEHHVFVDTGGPSSEMPPATRVPSTRMSTIMSTPARPVYDRVEFSHPLWVLYSSGTTGKPKGIVHGHGGIVLEANKANGLQYDLGPGDRVYFAVSTTWVAWNMLVASMMRGATVVTYDGAPSFGTPARHLEICSTEQVSFFGVGAAVLTEIQRSGMSPRALFDFSKLDSILSTGSPLPESTWLWIHDHVKNDVHLGSDSGGTDIASGIVGSNPFDPTYVGELQGPYLGVAADTVDPEGRPVVGEVGELVMTEPLPSMPVKFWNDPDGSRYRAAYFEDFPGMWRQGDWATRRPEGPFVIHGRSDSTINRGGIRMGSADICEVVDTVPGVRASMVIGAELARGEYYMPLFVVPDAGFEVDDELRESIVSEIRSKVSPRYVPDEIIAAPSVPRTRTGKLMEVPVKRLYQGADPDAVSYTATDEPDTLRWYVERASAFARRRHAE
ncbi:acetoacetate--CoA ligase [Dietzia sp. DQ12-76]|nr:MULTISPECIES: acetoacetate--CoA ligase [unclassified Dietzia]MBB1025399.1 acetoacetate--CoA ligase [Dietzia sp. DQ12-76]MBB1026790.1 acetoacetate--CoA ligase [Dietzia sp. DQ11-38-2]